MISYAQRCGALIGILAGLLICLWLLSACNYTSVRVTKLNGTVIEGKRIGPAWSAEGVYFNYTRDGDQISGMEFRADKVKQAGPENYASGVVAGIKAVKGDENE